MSAGSRGSHRERQVADMLREDGWVVYRSAGSHGCADLVAMAVRALLNVSPTGARLLLAIKADELDRPVLLQVKATAKGAYDHFGPAERIDLKAEALRAGADAVLVWWPPRRPPMFIDSSDWPAPPALRLVA